MAEIRSDARGAIVVLTIDRDERRNALDAELCEQLASRLHAAQLARAVVVAGAGRAFCAGADLSTRFADGDARHGGSDTFRPAFERVLDAVVAHPAPVIAAVHGAALGAGMQLAVACDLRVAAPDARFAIPGGRLGILLSAANVTRLALLVGHGLARDFLLTGREVDGLEARAVGLVQRVEPDPLAAAVALAEHVAELAPLSVQGHKRALNLVASTGAPGDAARAEMAALEAAAFASDDLREGMAAFAERRRPVFRGR